MAPDLNSKDQIRLARGLKLGETRDEYIRNNIANWMAVTGEDQGEAQQNLGNIYDGSTGSSVSYEDAFAATKEANPKATDEEINKFLADQGITPSS